MLSEKEIPAYHACLLDWFKDNQRIFPWRATKNPYKILIAEKLLQQTRARELVVNIYEKLIKMYPNAQALAKAKPTELENLIEPLGLKYRSKEMVQMGQELQSKYNGNIPDEYDKLIELFGVGDYCARAVLTFAYRKSVAIVDTNVARFLHRLLGIQEPLPQNPARKKYLQELAQELLYKTQPRDYNLAILDLCASICTSRNPKCDECPVNKFCQYAKHEAPLIGTVLSS